MNASISDRAVNYSPPAARLPIIDSESHTLINKANIRNGEVLKRFENAAVTMRMIEMRNSPVEPAFNMAHLLAIHRRLFQDVYEWAGKINVSENETWNQVDKYSGSGRTHGEGTISWLNNMRTEMLAAKENKEQVVSNVAMGLLSFNEWNPFIRGNSVVAHVYMGQLAKAAGYDLDLGRVHPSRMEHAYRDAWRTKEHEWGPIPTELRQIVREVARPLRAGAFAEALRDNDRTRAVERFPELGSVFSVLDRARSQIQETHGQRVWEKQYERVVKSVQRELDTGLDPQKSWNEKLERMIVNERVQTR